MKTIVSAIDFSDVSEKVLAQSQELAAATGAKLYVVHVVEQLAAFYDIYGYTVPDIEGFEAHARERAETSLKEKASVVNLPADKMETVVLEGPIQETLLNFMDTQQADLLVVGSHGHGLVARVLLGSTAQRILNKCEVPVLVVPA